MKPKAPQVTGTRIFFVCGPDVNTLALPGEILETVGTVGNHHLEIFYLRSVYFTIALFTVQCPEVIIAHFLFNSFLIPLSDARLNKI